MMKIAIEKKKIKTRSWRNKRKLVKIRKLELIQQINKKI